MNLHIYDGSVSSLPDAFRLRPRAGGSSGRSGRLGTGRDRPSGERQGRAFDQGSYHESYPFTISNDDSAFSVAISAASMLGSVGGTWVLEGKKLKLDIASAFARGGSYSYTAECEKAE